MLLTFGLYLIAVLLFIYILRSLLRRTGSFGVAEALAALAIVVTIILALRASAPAAPTTVVTSTDAPSLPPASTSAPIPTTVNTPTATPVPPTPTFTPSPSPTQIPAPTPTPTPQPGTVLYQADWSNGANGWPSTYGWKVLNGTLLNDASAIDGSWYWKTIWIPAPYQTTGIDDYAVEAEIQLARIPDYCWSYGIVARGAYQAGMHKCAYNQKLKLIGNDVGEFASHDFSPDTNKHVYRFEVKGNTLRLLIDGAVILDSTNNRYLSGKEVGIWSERTEMTVYSFKVIKM